MSTIEELKSKYDEKIANKDTYTSPEIKYIVKLLEEIRDNTKK